MNRRHGMLVVVMLAGLSGCGSMPGWDGHWPFMDGYYMMGDELRAQFVGKTVYAKNVRTGTTSESYYTADGHVRQRRNGNLRTGQWYIGPKGRMCLLMEDAVKPSCRAVVMGKDGVVKKYRRSNKRWKLSIVYEKFVNGNVNKL